MGRITETVKVLIIINAICFVGTLISGDLVYRLFSLFYFENPKFQIWQPLTHMFMHGGFMHILFNMYALWAFGSPLEMRWGRKKFLFFYFSAGFGAALIHTLVNYYQIHSGYDALLAAGMDQSQIMTLLETGQYNTGILESVSKETIQTLYNNFNTPAVGASGAIYGILVAFGLMFPNIELMLIFLPIPIKAKYFIPLIILGDLFFGITGSPFGIAHWAHIGGALFGFIMAYYWKKNSFDSTRWD
ncbi:rhomboid family intramembrane serine protease [Marixanthomonas ophiurae]|uniref:Rhomboid family intramembrane serine protease n=1 Tax=Marixanthomonas ophiurae TaxID=387659 RepID=A0A3E1Q6G1_9FLAO|nr:rhomboid family intramembrane serine protease [Marixanthomonas ophiurae]RFN57714.1 rhomboid family intramembrane serine protease [Marixanthomonas ophiurae]